MKYHRLRTLTAVATAVVVAGACTDSTGSTGMGSVEVTMQQVSGPAAQAVDLFLSPTGVAAKVAKSEVDSLFIWVSSIGFLPVDSTEADTTDSGEEEEYPWIWLGLADIVRIDLMALPADTDSVVVIGAGEVPVGDYRKLRMIVADASIYFNNMISVGNQVYDIDVEYSVDVPSGAQSGLKTDASFTVAADSVTADPLAVNVLFDPDMTFNNVTATGSGRVKITPVLKTR